MTILLLEPIQADARALLADFERTVLPDTAGALERALDSEPIHAILTRGRGRIDDALIARCPELRVVARCGVGLDNIDLVAAKRRGIAVIYAPGSTTSAVAEHEHRQSGFLRARTIHDQVDVSLVLGEFLDVVAFAVGFAAAAQVQRVDGETAG